MESGRARTIPERQYSDFIGNELPYLHTMWIEYFGKISTLLVIEPDLRNILVREEIMTPHIMRVKSCTKQQDNS